MDWKTLVDMAQVDINAALVNNFNNQEALDHLRDAARNLDRAVEALEETLEPPDDAA